MGRVMNIFCDSCKKEVKRPYWTLSTRRYTANGGTIRSETIWLCDKCYKRFVVDMMLPPYDEEERE